MAEAPASDHPFTPDLFERMDEGDDALFYTQPRKVVHIDDRAIAAVRKFFGEIFPGDAELLDLMASWRSHLPAELSPKRVVGLGMNAEEMADNQDLDSFVVHDLNHDPALPFGDVSFDGAVLTVSMQYLTSPIAVFRDVGRVLRPRGPFVVVISHRCFPTKAVKIWHQCRSMRERMELAMAYFQYSRVFAEVEGVDLRPGARGEEDPVLAIVGRRLGEPASLPGPKASWRRR